MKTEKEVKKALIDSRKYFRQNFEDMKYNKTVIKLDDIKKSIEALAVSNEICTLNWVLGKGVLNCYNKYKEYKCRICGVKFPTKFDRNELKPSAIPHPLGVGQGRQDKP